MTPGARIGAAIGILDAVLAGAPAEKALTNWGRRSRFAGSGDRHAVRDLVFDALRRRRSLARLGGADSGRGLMLGRLRAAGMPAAGLFTGVGHAPAPPTPAAAAALAAPVRLGPPEALDCPDWLWPRLRASLGPDAGPVLAALRERAPLHLRVNLLRGDRDAAARALAAEGVETRPHPLAATALEVLSNPRKVQTTRAWLDGLVEVQDAASQAVVAALPMPRGRVLDFCAGGGGKTLALAARGPARFFAHDASPARMRDLPARAARAGVAVECLAPEAVAGRFELVLADVPCSGSGAWRRGPEAKWTLDAGALARLNATQDAILARCAGLVAPGGALAYVTCSLLDDENSARIGAFLAARPGWRAVTSRRLTPLDGGDGFFVAVLVPPNPMTT